MVVGHSIIISTAHNTEHRRYEIKPECSMIGINSIRWLVLEEGATASTEILNIVISVYLVYLYQRLFLPCTSTLTGHVIAVCYHVVVV